MSEVKSKSPSQSRSGSFYVPVSLGGDSDSPIKPKTKPISPAEARKVFNKLSLPQGRLKVIPEVSLHEALSILGMNTSPVTISKYVKSMNFSDKGLSYDDFKDVVKYFNDTKMSIDAVIESFNALDLDNDGLLSKEEFRGYLANIRKPEDRITGNSFDAMYEAVDPNCTGYVSLKLLLEMLFPHADNEQFGLPNDVVADNSTTAGIEEMKRLERQEFEENETSMRNSYEKEEKEAREAIMRRMREAEMIKTAVDKKQGKVKACGCC